MAFRGRKCGTSGTKLLPRFFGSSVRVPQGVASLGDRASVQRRKYVVLDASTIRRRGVQPQGAREQGLGQSRPPGCDQRSGRDHYPHTRPPVCDYPCQPDQTQLRPPLAAWHGAPMPLTATPSDSHPATRSAETAAEGGTSRAHTGHYAANRIPGLRRAGPQGHGGVSVAVPELLPPDPRLHHDGLPTQRFITRSRCR
jgi:hypothetical protein